MSVLSGDLQQVFRRDPLRMLGSVPLAQIHRQPIKYFAGRKVQRTIGLLTVDEEMPTGRRETGLPEGLNRLQTAAAECNG